MLRRHPQLAWGAGPTVSITYVTSTEWQPKATPLTSPRGLKSDKHPAQPRADHMGRTSRSVSSSQSRSRGTQSRSRSRGRKDERSSSSSGRSRRRSRSRGRGSYRRSRDPSRCRARVAAARVAAARPRARVAAPRPKSGTARPRLGRGGGAHDGGQRTTKESPSRSAGEHSGGEKGEAQPLEKDHSQKGPETAEPVLPSKNATLKNERKPENKGCCSLPV